MGIGAEIEESVSSEDARADVRSRGHGVGLRALAQARIEDARVHSARVRRRIRELGVRWWRIRDGERRRGGVFR